MLRTSTTAMSMHRPHQVSEPVLVEPPFPKDVRRHYHVTGAGIQVLVRVVGGHAAAQLQAAGVCPEGFQRC